MLVEIFLISPSPKALILIYWLCPSFLKNRDLMQVVQRIVFNLISSAKTSRILYFFPFYLECFVIVPLSISMQTIFELRFFLKLMRF